MRLLNRKFPTLIGLILIIVGIVVTTILTKNGSNLITRAGPGIEPKNVVVTNITESAFTVSYLTDDQVIGTMDIGADLNNLSEQFLDDRDQLSQTVNKYNVHSISVRGLSPNTLYVFSINSGGQKFDNDSYKTKTGSEINDDPLDENPITGTVVLPDGTNPKEAIVYLRIAGAQKISTLTKGNGNYLIPLNSLRKEDLESYYRIQDDDNINIEVLGQNLTSTINLTLNKANPIPLITLSNNYSFADEEETIESSEINSSFPKIESNINSNDPKISSPKTNEGINDSQPEFEGTGLPNETIEIEINSEETITATIKTDSKGNWTYRPNVPLSPGQHTVTIKSKNRLGILKTITQSFTVHAAGSQVEQNATPSTILNPTLTASTTPTIIPSLIPTEITPLSTLPPTGPPSILIAGIGGLITTVIGIAFFLVFH